MGRKLQQQRQANFIISKNKKKRSNAWLFFKWVLISAVIISLFNLLLSMVPYFADREDFATSCELANLYNYDCEEHFATTKDGYILSIHRVNKRSDTNRKTKNKPVILLMHCLECDSSAFLTNTAENSLGFILAEADIDVWIGNFRGTLYSMRHVTLSKSDSRFWDFTWQEMAWFDLPAIVDYVLQTTNEKQIFYLGHSQGTLTAFAQMSESVEFQSKIKKAYMLSPFVTLQNIRSRISYLLEIVDLVGPHRTERKFFPVEQETFGQLSVISFYEDVFGLGTLLYNQFGGETTSEHLNKSRIPVFFSHGMSGTSLKNIRHYAQLHLFKNATYFDHYSLNRNQQVYKEWHPPVVDLGKVRTPVALFAAENDWLVSRTDVDYLMKRLPNVFYHKTCSDFSHLDFIWGSHANDCANDVILNDIMTSFIANYTLTNLDKSIQ